jgi:hypothetical protein
MIDSNELKIKIRHKVQAFDTCPSTGTPPVRG